MAGGMRTHEFAEWLGKLQATLLEGPDLPLADLLKALGVEQPKPARRARQPVEPLPPLDIIGLSREALADVLQDKRRFRTKKALAEFARQHGVAVSEKDRVAAIIAQILRVLHDIPRERTELRGFE
jgi:hypothetical protein